MLSSDVGPLQIDLVGVHRAFSVEGSPCGGELGATPADQRPAADGPKETTLRQHRSVDIRRPVSGLSTARDALAIVQPATVIRWHRAGFRAYWRWKSRARGGRPTVPLEVRRLIRAMSLANPLWGAPRMHGELLKLGIDVGQTSVTKYMARRRRPPSQGWRTFLRNHADGIVAMDLFVVPTISFQLLPEWIARQLTEACGWDQAPILSVASSKGYGSYCAMLVRNHTLAISIKGAVLSLEVLCNARTRRRNCPLGAAI